MTIRHFTVAATGLACAALTLTSFGVAGPAAASTVSRSASSGTAVVSAAKPAKMPDCTARAAGMRIIQTVDASASGATLTARETKFVCGGPNDGDGYFLAVGKPEKFHFAAGASASVLNGIHSKQVSVAELLRFVHKCAGSGAGTVQYPSSCNGQFAITVNKAGKITAVKQRYHS